MIVKLLFRFDLSICRNRKIKRSEFNLPLKDIVGFTNKFKSYKSFSLFTALYS